MEQIKEALDAFMAEVKDTPEYRNYVMQRDKIKAQPQLKAQIDEYRKRNFELQNSDDSDGKLFEKLEQLEKEYAVVCENPLVGDFLEAELALCRMVQQINLQVVNALEFE